KGYPLPNRCECLGPLYRLNFLFEPTEEIVPSSMYADSSRVSRPVDVPLPVAPANRPVPPVISQSAVNTYGGGAPVGIISSPSNVEKITSPFDEVVVAAQA